MEQIHLQPPRMTIDKALEQPPRMTIDKALDGFFTTRSNMNQQPNFTNKSLRMEIAIHAMCALLEKDFKNIGYSAFNSGKGNVAEYVADQAFMLADAMIKREQQQEKPNE